MSTEQVKKVVKKASSEQVVDTIKSAVNNEKLIYVGPQAKGLQRFSIFQGGYPASFKEHIDKSPAFKQMFVPLNRFNEVQMNLLNANSVESMLYVKAKEYLEGVK